MSQSKLYRGQGPLLIAIQNPDGSYGKTIEMGSVSAAQFDPKTTDIQHRESYSGRRAIDKIVEVTTECGVSLTVENFNVDALAIHLRSNVTASAAGAFAGVVVGAVAALAVGDVLRVPGLGITGLTMEDSSAPAVPLVEGTHYEAISEAHGVFRVLSLAGLTGDIKASGDKAATKTVKAISRKKITAKISFLGINTAEDDEPSLVEAVVSLAPASAFSLISDQVGTYEVKGDCLYRNGGFFTAEQLA